MLINHILPSFLLCSSFLFEKHKQGCVRARLNKAQSLLLIIILNTYEKSSEGFSLFSAVNILWLIKDVRTTLKLNAMGGHLPI
jgi:hypothetical protein